MNIDALSSSPTVSAALLAAQANASAAPSAAQLQADRESLAASTTTKKSNQATPEQIKKAASQFEAIIIRQLLEPSIQPIMSGGLGESSASAGGGIYGYMLTDAMANNLAQGGGLGLAHLLEKQFTAAPTAADKSNTASGQK